MRARRKGRVVQSGDIACDGVMPLIQQELCGYCVITVRIILHGLPSIIHSLALDTQPLLLNTLVNYVLSKETKVVVLTTFVGCFL